MGDLEAVRGGWGGHHQRNKSLREELFRGVYSGEIHRLGVGEDGAGHLSETVFAGLKCSDAVLF